MKKNIYILFTFLMVFTSCIEIIEKPEYNKLSIDLQTRQQIYLEKDNVNDTEFLTRKTNNYSYITSVSNDTISIHMENAGTLYSIYKSIITGEENHDEYGEEVWDNVKTIILEGNIDARDFSTIKWNFRNVENIDISKTHINYYYGDKGTNEGYNYEYMENEIPLGAFFYWMCHFYRNFPEELIDEGMASLKSIILPDNITTINCNAIARAYNIKEITIPETVKNIGFVSFRHCHSIEKLYIPKSVLFIDYYAFTDMNSLTEVHMESTTPPDGNDVFGYWRDATNYEVFGLTESDIEVGNMSTINYLPYSKTTLYVPKGSKSAYNKWEQYFKEIIEE